tara:strand:- start:110 stop:526 length:417 start_codon:yes stop_codon:yes gene_type:complete
MSCVLISCGKRLVDGVVNDTNCKVYNWNDGDIEHLGMGIVSVLYKVGIHTTGIQMIEKGYTGYYIKKYKKHWFLIGMFISANKVDDETYRFVINTNIPNTGPMDTDKERSMARLGYKKTKGKGTGHWGWGFTMLEPIN